MKHGARLGVWLALLMMGLSGCSEAQPENVVRNLSANGDTIYHQLHYGDYGGGQLFRSDDGGRTWHATNAAPAEVWGYFEAPPAPPIAKCVPSAPDVCYRVTKGATVERSTDSGASWEPFWSAPADRRSFAERFYRQMKYTGCERQPPNLTPLDVAIADRGGGQHDLAVAMGNEGVVALSSLGRASRHAIECAAPVPLAVSGVAAALKATLWEALALAVAFLVAGRAFQALMEPGERLKRVYRLAGALYRLWVLAGPFVVLQILAGAGPIGWTALALLIVALVALARLFQTRPAWQARFAENVGCLVTGIYALLFVVGMLLHPVVGMVGVGGWLLAPLLVPVVAPMIFLPGLSGLPGLWEAGMVGAFLIFAIYLDRIPLLNLTPGGAGKARPARREERWLRDRGGEISAAQWRMWYEMHGMGRADVAWDLSRRFADGATPMSRLDTPAPQLRPSRPRSTLLLYGVAFALAYLPFPLWALGRVPDYGLAVGLALALAATTLGLGKRLVAGRSKPGTLVLAQPNAV